MIVIYTTRIKFVFIDDLEFVRDEILTHKPYASKSRIYKRNILGDAIFSDKSRTNRTRFPFVGETLCWLRLEVASGKKGMRITKHASRFDRANRFLDRVGSRPGRGPLLKRFRLRSLYTPQRLFRSAFRVLSVRLTRNSSNFSMP